MGLGRRTTDPAAMETLKAIRQIAVSLAKNQPMEALAVAGNVVQLLQSKVPLNEQQREAVKQFLQTLNFNKVPLGPAETAPLIQKAEALVKEGAPREAEAPVSTLVQGLDDRVPVEKDSPEFRSIMGALRTHEDRLEMMQVDHSLQKMPKEQARQFLQYMQESIQAIRQRYLNDKVDDTAQRVLQKARDIYRSI